LPPDDAQTRFKEAAAEKGIRRSCER